MKSLLEIFDVEANFWKVNPQFKGVSIFKDIYKKDKSKGKERSSNTMWAISAFYDPKSPYVDIPEDKTFENSKSRVISKDLFGDSEWLYNREGELKEHRDLYEELMLTPAMRSLRVWEKKIKERDSVLEETPYMVGMTDDNGKLVGSNVEVLDKMFERTPKLWDQFFKIQEALSNEEAGNSVKGGSLESLTDTGEI
jgi:hypothetical protein